MVHKIVNEQNNNKNNGSTDQEMRAKTTLLASKRFLVARGIKIYWY